jgi:hypothetical protein
VIGNTSNPIRGTKMGADWYSMTCIGLKVPKEKIIREEDGYKNNCRCMPKIDPDDYPGARFCPHCGNHIKRAIKIEKPLFDIPEDYWNDKGEIKGWEIKHDTDACNFYICVFTSGDVIHDKRSDIPELSKETLNKFKTDMKSIGLWDEKEFGLWTITRCDY